MLGAVKIVVFVLLFANGLRQLVEREPWWFSQTVNLVFHEAGHVIFYVFGQFMALLGGSLLEVLIPTVVTAVFVFQKSWFSAACTSWWCMTAWLSVSIYASDAQERALPLITGDVNTHDWFNLLSQTNLIHLDNVIGGIFWTIALLCLLFGAVLIAQDKHVRAVTRPRR